jgi:hypothetical protein
MSATAATAPAINAGFVPPTIESIHEKITRSFSILSFLAAAGRPSSVPPDSAGA